MVTVNIDEIVGTPRLEVTSATALADVTRETKVDGTMVITNAFGSSYTTPQLYNGYVKIKGSGNGSWGFNKKSYSFDPVDVVGADVEFPLFGWPSGKDYRILPDCPDKTLFRNQLAFYLSKCLGLPWSSRNRKVEFYYNGEYRGVYTMVEKIKRGSTRVDIKKMANTDNSGANLTGGYLIESNALVGSSPPDVSEPNLIFDTYYYRIETPKSTDITTQQRDYIFGQLSALDNAVKNIAFDDLTNGYRAYIDVDSFARYYLAQELFGNWESNSQWFYKERSQKIKASPVWDYDLAFGNTATYQANIQSASFAYWPYLLEDPYFEGRIKALWAESRDNLSTFRTFLSKQRKALNDSGALARQIARLGADNCYYLPAISPNASYDAQYDFLVQNVQDRIAWMDARLDYSVDTDLTLGDNDVILNGAGKSIRIKS